MGYGSGGVMEKCSNAALLAATLQHSNTAPAGRRRSQKYRIQCLFARTRNTASAARMASTANVILIQLLGYFPAMAAV